ncbi:MAG TPA: cysteine desulfurase family protein, partial [Thermomicrobiales bacterium]|nr:cysteine desulfurase family protein [Thermomicrobiales bacterium]
MTPDETRIYLDHAATTPVDPAVVAAMLPYWTARWGNPSSLYAAGRAARAALDAARAAVAAVLRCAPGEVIFTSGGTEGDNLALKGVVEAALLAGRGRHLVTTAIEHHAILHTAAYLERFGAAVTYLPVDAAGCVAPAAVAAALRPDTCLVSVMYANNEIGTIEPLAEIAALTRPRGIPFHTDAVQAASSLPLDVDALGVDLLTLAAHKFYGPKGVGALYVRAGTPLLYQQQGGPQEGDRRGGTENVALAVGLAAALDRAAAARDADNAHCRALRDRLVAGILAAIPGARLNGPAGAGRLSNNVNVAFPGVDGESLIIALDLAGVAASSGSA